MAWFKSKAKNPGYAALAVVPGGVAALRLAPVLSLAATATPVVAAYAWHENAPSLQASVLSQIAQEIGAREARLICLLDIEHYQTVVVDAPSVADEELRAALRWKVKELINFHIDDAVIDHLPLPGGGGRPPSLYIVAAQAPAVRALAQACQTADLPLEVIDVRETAQHHIGMRLAPADYAVAVLHIEGDQGLLTFSFGDDLILSRRIDGRGASGDFLYDRVALEVQRSVDYFERQHSWFPLAKLHVAPQADAQVLRNKLVEYLPVGVELIDLASLFNLSAVPALSDPLQQNRAFHLLGAALRDAA